MNPFFDSFLSQVRIRPDSPAVMDHTGAETYAMINRSSARLAESLLHFCRSQETGLKEQCAQGGNGLRIALLLPRTRSYVTAMLAVIRAGCSFVPLDAEYPAERIRAILQDAGCVLCITTQALVPVLSGFPVLTVESVLGNAADQPGEVLEDLNLSGVDLEGFILYTSGSTGRPKGVIHRQGTLSCGLEFLKEYHIFTPDDRIGCMAGFSFIASLYDLIPPLMTGGCVYIVDETERKNTDMLHTLIRRRKLTGMYLPPRLWSVMRDLYGPLPLRYVLLAGEKARTAFQDDGLIEGYGTSETGGILIHRISPENPRMIGRPGGGAEVILLDDEGRRITGPGQVGELCVVSPWLALGYVGLPDETAARFTGCPFIPGSRMFHTGDYLAYDDEGNLLFHGRRDRLVKLRGYRVELDEIGNVLRRAGGIGEAVCVVRRVGGGDKLCCFYTGSKEDESSLRTYAAAYLPEYMTPDYLVRLEALPRNERGKVDFRALQELDIPESDVEYIPPEGETEEMICASFASVLELPRVSAQAGFFDLGGTSLSVSVLIVKLSSLRPGLSFQDIVQHPTPRSLAAFLTEKPKEDMEIPALDRDFYPLTRTQLGIYLESVTGGNETTYSSPYLMKADPAVTAEQLISAVQAVLSAHPSMKYIIRAGADGMPHMFPVPDEKVEIPVIDGSSDGRLEFMRTFMPVIPLTDHLLFRFAVYRTPERCYLAFRGHLIFIDGTSISLLIAELNRALTGQPLLPEKYTIQQVGIHEEQLMRNGSFDQARHYFENLFREMDDIPPLTGDRDGPLTPGVSSNLRYDPGTLTAERVRTFCDRIQITESSFFLGAMALMLSKYLHSRRVSFSTVYNGRNLSGTDHTIGTLIRRIPVFGDLSRDLPVADFLKRMSRQVFSNMSHDIYSFDEVLKTCPVNDDVELIYQGDLFTDRMGASGGASLVEGDSWFMEHYHTGMVTGCFSIQLFSTGGRYSMTLEYRDERFSPEWAWRFAENMFLIAEGLLTHARIGEIAMVSDRDRKALDRFNRTKADISFMPVQEQIHRWAQIRPDSPAVTAAGKTLTFRELDCLSDRVAASLLKRGLKRETLVGVLFSREVWAYVAEIGILKAGGAFVPFIPDCPDERIAFCLEDGRIPFLLTQAALYKERTGLSVDGHEIIILEDLLKEETPLPPAVSSGRNELAYCIYTSGTTGRPKGVMIEHGNIANYVFRCDQSPEIMHYAAPGRICLALAAFSFDVSVVEAFVPLCNGNPVVMATEEEIHTPAKLAGLIRENGVNGITCTPTYLLSLLDIPESQEAIRQLTFFDIGAEAFPACLYDRLRALRRDSIIMNVYGPTEATMGCSAEEMADGRLVTVGSPIANTCFLVADPFGNELPPGIRGELIICGDQVGRGYINLPDKTSQSFFRFHGMRAYRSGDLAAWTPDGKIRIYGRIDQQVKLRGFRIELDEIEKVMTEYPGIKSGVVSIRENNGTDYLIGYYTAQSPVLPDELLGHLRARLPEYMVPSSLIFLNDMPLTSSGKVDRRALPAPDFSAFRAPYSPPRTETEKALCRGFAKALRLAEEQVGVQDDFFELGGDSLKAMIALAEADLESLTAADIFQKRTPRAIAEAVGGRSGQSSLDEREAEARKLPHSLTPVQIQMLDHQLFRPGSTMWNNVHFLVRFDPTEVNENRLCDAVNRALRNHPSLSVAFFFNDRNELVQQYIPGLLPEVRVQHIRRETAESLPDVLLLPFDRLLNACLCRVRVLRSPDAVFLFMDLHHLLLDGGSLGVLLGDITDAWFGRELKKDYYFSIIADEEKRIREGSRDRDRAWFRERYGEEVWCRMLPPGKEKRSVDQGILERRLPFDAADIRAAEEYWDVSHSVMAISAALLALARVTGKQHVMVTWIFNNRLSPEAGHVVGMLMKNLPAAARMEEYKSLLDLLLSVKNQVAEGIAHSTYDDLEDWSRAYQDESIEVDLQLEINGSELEALHPVQVPLNDGFRASRYMLELDLLENEYGDGGFDLKMEYAKGLFDPEQAESFHHLYISILNGIILRDPEQAENLLLF